MAILPREHEELFNKAPLVRAVTALLLVIFTLSTITRIITRWIKIGSFKSDDTFIVSSTLLAIGQSIAVILKSSHGFGKPIASIDSSDVSYILKAQYAADALYAVSLLTAKLSATGTMMDMAPRKSWDFITLVELLIVLWAVSSTLVSLFQCHIPTPWDYINGQCINRAAFWIYFEVMNAITDLAIIRIVFNMFSKLQIPMARKVMVISIFGSRILTIPAIICFIYYFGGAVNSTDPTFDMWPPTIITQVIQCMSIVVTCLPSIIPLLDALQSGQWVTGDLRRSTNNSSKRSRSGDVSAALSPNKGRRPSEGKGSRGLRSVLSSNKFDKIEEIELDGMHNVNADRAKAAPSAGPDHIWDRRSHGSETVLI